MPTWIDYLGVAILGGAVGLAELCTRYRDEPLQAVSCRAGIAYIVINALAALIGLLLIDAFGWTFDFIEGDGQAPERLVRVLVAGTATMALLRSAILQVRMGGQDIGIGPHAILQIILGVVDGAVDRTRGAARNELLANLKPFSFAKAQEILPARCLGLLQQCPPEEQQRLSFTVAAISQMNTSDREKGHQLALAVVNLVGEKLFVSVFDSLYDEIKT